MAAALARRFARLLRPLGVSACSSAPRVGHISTLVHPPRLCNFNTPSFTAAVPAALSPTPGCILQRVTALAPRLTLQPSRPLTYFGMRKGKRKSVPAVTKRFMRLHCGLWIRRKAGYKKRLWKKLPARRKRLREIVFCTKTQCKLFDKMTTSFWRRRNWYLDDPYLKYHDRVNLK